jgi:hypothetical protein
MSLAASFESNFDTRIRKQRVAFAARVGPPSSRDLHRWRAHAEIVFFSSASIMEVAKLRGSMINGGFR